MGKLKSFKNLFNSNKKKLDDDYIISGENMLDITEPVGNFRIKTTKFGNFQESKVKVLYHMNKQIFSMKDGIYILEVENYLRGSVKYYYSTDINDLI